MALARVLLISSLVFVFTPATAATVAAEDDGWQAFGHALTLVQTLVGIAARSDGPQANLKGIDDVLAGRNSEANRAIAGLLEDATADMPLEYRDRVAAIGRDLTSLARRGLAQTPAEPVSTEGALQARKELNAMGLAYYDPKQFLDAVRRDDALAVELYVAGRGVNLASRGADGRSAFDIARANGNPRVTELLSRNLPAGR